MTEAGSPKGSIGARVRWAVVPVLLLAAACGGGGSSDPARSENAAAGGNGDDETCTTELPADGPPVELTLWHGYTFVTEDVIQELVDDFNDAQDVVEVKVVTQDENIVTKLVAGRTTGDLADLVIVNEIELQRMIDTELTMPIGPCLAATGFPVDDLLPQALDYYTVEGAQWAMPFNVAGPVLIYNAAMLEEAGLPSDQPPATLEELHTTALAVKDSGAEAGIGFERYGWIFEQFIAMAGEHYMNNDNGRSDRATDVAFGGSAGQELFATIEAMLADGSMVTSASGGTPEHLIGVGEQDWAMTITSSSALGPILETLLEGQYAAGDIAVAPMPGATEAGGPVVGGGAIHLVSPDGDPAVAAAAWQFIEHLSTVETSAYFSARTGYLPARQSAVDEDVLQEHWDEAPYFRVAYDQMLEGAVNTATAGAVFGDMEAIREVVEDAWRRMDAEGLSAEDALARVVEEADNLVERYNEDVLG